VISSISIPQYRNLLQDKLGLSGVIIELVAMLFIPRGDLSSEKVAPVAFAVVDAA
jgi:hypothetical protein